MSERVARVAVGAILLYLGAHVGAYITGDDIAAFIGRSAGFAVGLAFVGVLAIQWGRR